jgi:hypothetical protein
MKPDLNPTDSISIPKNNKNKATRESNNNQHHRSNNTQNCFYPSPPSPHISLFPFFCSLQQQQQQQSRHKDHS